jgi:TetR/AcrR family transcriptional regulator
MAMGRNIRGGEPKERIMRAAKKEFSGRGFSGARMSEIAKGACVNKALIHYYFKDKETLYVELLRRAFRGSGKVTEDRIPESMGKWDLSPSQRLYVIIYMMSNIFLKATDPDIMRIFFWEMAEGTRYLDSMMQEFTMPRQKMINDVVLEGIRTGEFETDFPKFAALNIGTFISFYTIHRELHRGRELFREMYGDASDQDVFQYVLESVFKSLKPRNRKLDIPRIPAEVKKSIDEMLNLLIEKKDEGVTEEAIKHVRTKLRH